MMAMTFAVGQSQPDPLTGRWRSSDVSPSGVSAIFEFRGDNQLDSYSSVISEQKYRLVGTDTIILRSKDGREEKLELEWDNPDRARIDDEVRGKSIELARRGKIIDSKNQLIGEWTTTREWNGKTYPARALFSGSGTIVWTIDLRVEHGRYSVQNENVRMEIPNRPVLEGRFGIAGDRLALPNPRGGESRFERF